MGGAASGSVRKGYVCRVEVAAGYSLADVSFCFLVCDEGGGGLLLSV